MCREGGVIVTDQEKRDQVIEELEKVIAEAVYPDRPRKFMMSLELAENALALLRKMEPQKGGAWKSWDEVVAGHFHEVSECPDCGFTTDNMSREDMMYCPNCGRFLPESRSAYT